MKAEISAGRKIGSGFVWFIWAIVVVVWTLVVAVTYLLTAWWDTRRWYAGRVFRIGAKLLVWLNPWWRVTIVGEVPPRSSEPFIAVCNHESMADILLIGTLPMEMKWLSKEAIARIPFLGWMMFMAGDVLVRRSDARSRGASYDELVAWINRGASVMMFPEGTRTRTGELLPFRNGAFRLAIDTGRPIQPMVVTGGRQAIEADSVWFGRARVTVRILDQVPVDGYEDAEVNELRDKVRGMISAARTPIGEGPPVRT